ncbi:MAG: hypothetical protein ACI8V2_003303 [Candidatus Latescibacterota bacterium]|jgi:hypothetical protein
MFERLRNRFKFHVERLLLRGAHFRLLVIASLVGLVAVVGGLLVQATDVPFDEHGTAIWWAFLRLTDPGYLGDDEGVARRIISTVVTVLGYVLFMGSLVAIMTQWLNQTIRNLERGLTPIARSNHILILGWTNRTPAIVEELMRSEGRVRRFLRRRGARGLHIVILSEDVSLERTLELRSALGELWNPKKITFRSGTPLRVEHLERVDFQNAGAIILPGGDFVYGTADESDTRIVKTLLSVATHDAGNNARPLPQLVTEIFDPHKVPMVKKAYRGVMEILASDVFVARCMAQNVRHPGLSRIFREILSHGDGSEIYVRTPEQFTGFRFGDLGSAYPRAVLLGVVRLEGDTFCPMLNPSEDLILESGDRLVFLARDYEDCEPPRNFQTKHSSYQPQTVSNALVKRKRKVLLLGWNHKAADLLAEFDRYLHEVFEIHVLSLTPIAERESDVIKKGVKQIGIAITHHEGDYTSLADLEALNPHNYDNVIILGSDRLETPEESDARTIVGHLVLTHVLGTRHQIPNLLVELMDADNLPLFDSHSAEVMVTPTMASHVLAQVALRRELNIVYEELFGPGGAEIFFRPPSDYGVEGQKVDFGNLKAMAACRGEIALGVRLKHGWVELNPLPDKQWVLDERDELVVLVRDVIAPASSEA